MTWWFILLKSKIIFFLNHSFQPRPKWRVGMAAAEASAAEVQGATKSSHSPRLGSGHCWLGRRRHWWCCVLFKTNAGRRGFFSAQRFLQPSLVDLDHFGLGPAGHWGAAFQRPRWLLQLPLMVVLWPLVGHHLLQGLANQLECFDHANEAKLVHRSEHGWTFDSFHSSLDVVAAVGDDLLRSFNYHFPFVCACVYCTSNCGVLSWGRLFEVLLCFYPYDPKVGKRSRTDENTLLIWTLLVISSWTFGATLTIGPVRVEKLGLIRNNGAYEYQHGGVPISNWIPITSFLNDASRWSVNVCSVAVASFAQRVLFMLLQKMSYLFGSWLCFLIVIIIIKSSTISINVYAGARRHWIVRFWCLAAFLEHEKLALVS